MIVFGIYNIVVSLALIIFSIYFIRQINEDIKKYEVYKKYDIKNTNKQIKISKKYRLLNYIVLVISVLVIIFTLSIFIINFMEVL